MKEAYNAVYRLLKYRRFPYLFSRALKIFKRYGLTSKSLENCLSEYVDLMQKYNCTPSFPITAQVLDRYPKLIERYLTIGIEFSIHGYRHLDYSQLLYQTKIDDFENAIDIFKQRNVPFSGFRCPYLKWNDELLSILSDARFCWDSSQTVIWDCIKREDFNNEKWKNYEKILAQYKPYHAQHCCIRPKLKNNLVEIPVSLPDDDILIDRLGITDEAIIADIWNNILDRTYERGELFTLQLHPERIHFCKEALDAILRRANMFNPPVWIASLNEIANWWKERINFSFDIIELREQQYRIKANCTERASILIKKTDQYDKREEFFNGSLTTGEKNFIINSFTKPVVGIPENVSTELIAFLKEEGFPFEVSGNKDKYGIYLEGFDHFNEQDGKELLKRIDSSTSPLIRFWRWPKKARSVLVISGDIDALSSVDFLLRMIGK